MNGRLGFATFILVALFCSSATFADDQALRRYCLQKINDDTIRKIPKSAAAIAYVSLFSSELKELQAVELKFKEPIHSDNSEPRQFLDLTYYRCMSGLVFVCSIMRNGACLRKADIRLSRPDLDQFCQKHPNESLSQAQIGHGSLYDWDCLDGKAKVSLGNRIDQRNFIADSWEPLVSDKNLKESRHR